MTLRFSTGLRNALNQDKATSQKQVTATTISFGDDTGSGTNDEILDSDSGLAGYSLYDKISVECESTTTNEGDYEILAVAGGAIEVAAGSFTGESAATAGRVMLSSSRGGSFSDLFRHGIMDIRSGTQPTTADQVESGTSLVKITLASGAFTKDLDPNGINFDASVAGVLGKRSDETWSGEGIETATAGWFRFYTNSFTPGASSTEIVFDGSIATSGSELNMSNTSITLGGTTTIDTVAITLPAA